jgi:hypothetical protein
MSSIVAYNAQGQQVKSHSSLFDNMNRNSLKQLNYKNFKFNNNDNMPTAVPSSVPQTYPSNKNPMSYQPQPLLRKQMENRYNQIQSQPKQSNYSAYSGNKHANYAAFNN